MKKLKLTSAFLATTTLLSPITMAMDPSQDDDGCAHLLAPFPSSFSEAMLMEAQKPTPQSTFESHQNDTAIDTAAATESTDIGEPELKKSRMSPIIIDDDTPDAPETSNPAPAVDKPTQPEPSRIEIDDTPATAPATKRVNPAMIKHPLYIAFHHRPDGPFLYDEKSLEQKAQYACISYYASLCTEQELNHISETITNMFCNKLNNDKSGPDVVFECINVLKLILIDQIYLHPSAETYSNVQGNLAKLIGVADNRCNPKKNFISPMLKEFSKALERCKDHIEKGENIHTNPETRGIVDNLFSHFSVGTKELNFWYNQIKENNRWGKPLVDIDKMLDKFSVAADTITPGKVSLGGIALVGLARRVDKVKSSIFDLSSRKSKIQEIFEKLKKRGLHQGFIEAIEKVLESLKAQGEHFYDDCMLDDMFLDDPLSEI